MLFPKTTKCSFNTPRQHPNSSILGGAVIYLYRAGSECTLNKASCLYTCLPYICPCHFSCCVQLTVSICRFLFLMVLVRVSSVYCLYFLHSSTVFCTFLLLLPSFLFVSCSFLPFSLTFLLRRLTRSFLNGCYGLFVSIFVLWKPQCFNISVSLFLSTVE